MPKLKKKFEILTEDDLPDVLTTEQAAHLLKVSQQEVCKLCRKREFGKKVGRDWRILKIAVYDFLKDKKDKK